MARVVKETDGLASKVAKYVPAEFLAIAMLFFANFAVTGWTLWGFVGLGAVLNALYLFSVSRQSKEPPATAFFYVLSAAAFVLWSLGTIDAVATEAHLSGNTSNGQRAFILALAAFLIPMLDALLSQRPTARTGAAPGASRRAVLGAAMRGITGVRRNGEAGTGDGSRTPDRPEEANART